MTRRVGYGVAIALCAGTLLACRSGDDSARSSDGTETSPPGPLAAAVPPSDTSSRLMSEAVGLYRQGRFDRALDTAIAALEDSPASNEPYRLVSKIFTDTGRDLEGIEFFREHAGRESGRWQPWLYKGYHEFHLNLWEPALESFQHACSLEPGNADAHSRSGMILEYMGEFDRSAEEFRAAHELEPATPRFAARYAKTLRMGGDYAGAERVITEALEFSPDSGDLLFALAQIRLRQQRADEAEQALRRAVELDPRNAAARKELAGILARGGNEAEARLELGTADRLDDYESSRRLLLERVGVKTGDPQLPLRLAELELTEEHFDPALGWYARAEELGGPSPRIRAGRAEALFSSGRAAEGEAELALLAQRNDPATAMARAARLEQRGEIERALLVASEAASQPAADRDLLRRVADLYARAGRPAESLELLGRAAAIPRPPAP